MEILSFDIQGKFAHFRKYYANNTALSFSLPPRTTIIGILGAILGRQRDSYYEEMSSDNIRIAISVQNPIKKTFHRLNFLSIKNLSDFRGKRGRIQTPFEIVTGNDISKNSVKYKIYLSYTDNGKETFREIKKCLLEKNFMYNTSLGTANFNAQISNVYLFEESQVIEQNIDNEYIELNSACISDYVKELNFNQDEENKLNFIEEELIPADFKSNYNRELSKMNRVLFTTNKFPLKVKFHGIIYQLKNEIETINIQFLE